LDVTAGRAKLVFHWFKGSASTPLGGPRTSAVTFSINSQMLMTDRGKALVSSLPIDRLLTETNGPFTSAGDGLAHPRDVEQTVGHLARAKGLSSEDSEAVVRRNLKKMTG
jgi:TatD DNase family protein